MINNTHAKKIIDRIENMKNMYVVNSKSKGLYYADYNTIFIIHLYKYRFLHIKQFYIECDRNCIIQFTFSIKNTVYRDSTKWIYLCTSS